MVYDVRIVGDGSSVDYDGKPPAHVLGSRGAEGTAVKALAKSMGHMDFDPAMFAAIFAETQSPVMQNRMMEMFLAMCQEWCSRWDTNIVDPKLDAHFDTMAKAAIIRDTLKSRGYWKA
jgi:hypothetical protein